MQLGPLGRVITFRGRGPLRTFVNQETRRCAVDTQLVSAGTVPFPARSSSIASTFIFRRNPVGKCTEIVSSFEERILSKMMRETKVRNRERENRYQCLGVAGGVGGRETASGLEEARGDSRTPGG